MHELAMLLRIVHVKDPKQLLRELERAEQTTTFRRTGQGRQPVSGGGVRLGDLMKAFGRPQVIKQIPPGAK